jgi:hypothetical protein
MATGGRVDAYGRGLDEFEGTIPIAWRDLKPMRGVLALKGLAVRLPLALAALVLLTFPGPAHALEQRLVASDGAAGDRLGESVAIDGETAAVGAPGQDGSRGAVYVFTRSGDSWTQSAKLTASDGAEFDFLGQSVAVDGDAIVAGAPGGDVGAGAVYSFARTGAAARTETAKLTASDGAVGDRLGTSVAIDGDTIVAGASGARGTAEGSVYTFARTGAAARTETAKLAASDAGFDNLGRSAAIDGDVIVAGAPGDGSAAGSADTFARTGAAARTETATLLPSDGVVSDRHAFGTSVAVHGDVIVAGAPGDEAGAGGDQGSAYTFARTGAARRTETAKLSAADGAADDRLGESVAIDGDAIVAGAPLDDVGANLDQGSASVFPATANVFSFGKVKRNRKKGTAKLPVNVPDRGELDLAKTKKVKPQGKRAPEEGKVKLTIKPRRRSKRALRKKGKAKVRAEVTYTPDGGDPNTESKRIKLIKRR